MRDERRAALTDWTNGVLNQLFPDQHHESDLQSVSGDASFRRYFRVQLEKRSLIAVDAPPLTEKNELFVNLTGLFRDAGVCTPKVFASDFESGFLLLDDFGNRLFLDSLLELQRENNIAEAAKMYHAAIDCLIKFQSRLKTGRLDPYGSELLRTEMLLFKDWFCVNLLELELDQSDEDLLEEAMSFLEREALSQRQLFVHRDYHSRNLMSLDEADFGPDCGPGVIDFQDAVCGSYAYDLVSLLRDCYIQWPEQQLEDWANYYYQLACSADLCPGISPGQFHRDLDFMGLQRNLKVMGIFSRLSIRDNKPLYLADIPLVIRNFLNVSQKYPELAAFRDWFVDKVLPTANTKLSLD